MADLEQTNPNSTEANPSTETQATATTDASTQSATSTGDPSADAAAAQAWTPDFKFKVMDKEYEIDPIFHSVIKDEETLKKVRRIQEQALGVPHLEASRDDFKNKYTTSQPRLQEYAQVEQRLNKLSHFVQQKDFGSFFSELKIPKEQVFQWMKSELDALDAPPEVQAQRQQVSDLARQKYEYEQELAYYRQQSQQTNQQQILQSIDNVITTEAGDVAKQFNDRMAEPLAFRNAVINKGQHIQHTTGQRPPVEEVIKQVKADLARVMGITEAQVATTGGGQAIPAPNAPQAAGNGKPPVIPVVKGGGQSPVKSPPKSLKELKEFAANFQN